MWAGTRADDTALSDWLEERVALSGAPAGSGFADLGPVVVVTLAEMTRLATAAASSLMRVDSDRWRNPRSTGSAPGSMF